MSLWQRTAAERIERDARSTIPYQLPPRDLFEPDLYVWDAWPVRTVAGDVATIDGWHVMIALSSARESGSAWPFYTRSTWRFWYTKDGNWQLGGPVFSREEALGSRQWAGSSTYDPNTGRVTFYYTAVGAPEAASLEDDTPPLAYPPNHPAAGRPSTVQRMAAVSAAVTTGPQGVAFDDFGEHRIILEADGELYQTHEQSRTDQVIYGMRDPWFWREPETGDDYILFTANAGFAPGTHNGVVGVARANDDGGWELLPPILGAPGVSSQLERPHLVRRGERLYLLFSTHAFTFADGLSGPEGLYGFVSHTGRLEGPWEPLNGSGLVAGNPPSAPTMTYSYLTLPDGWVMSYLNTAGGELTESAPGKFFGGPAPLFRVAFDGARSELVDNASGR
jgi:levansucrase